jgi:cellulose synthase/poly-beta-1,6-N-acetylglucosamine synthase-like glycosyltransferase
MLTSESKKYLKKQDIKKVLVCCPTAKAKNYCFVDWIDNVASFTYPKYEVVMYDNTDDNGENARLRQSEIDECFNQLKIKIYHIKMPKKTDLVERLCKSHNSCVDYMLKNEFEYMLHLESDVFPEPDIIESLLFHKKQIVGGLYSIGDGDLRGAMIQQMIDVGFGIHISKNFLPKEDIYFVDGTLKKVASIGLGCVLIHKSVFEKVRFRSKGSGVFCFPDSFFSEDCFKEKIPIHLDTSKIAYHKNRQWDI